MKEISLRMNESMTLDCEIISCNACVWLLAYIQANPAGLKML